MGCESCLYVDCSQRDRRKWIDQGCFRQNTRRLLDKLNIQCKGKRGMQDRGIGRVGKEEFLDCDLITWRNNVLLYLPEKDSEIKTRIFFCQIKFEMPFINSVPILRDQCAIWFKISRKR